MNKPTLNKTKSGSIGIIWGYANKFIRFFISVLIGFFLTTIYPIFKLLNSKKMKPLIVILIFLIISFFYIIIKLMLGYTG